MTMENFEFFWEILKKFGYSGLNSAFLKNCEILKKKIAILEKMRHFWKNSEFLKRNAAFWRKKIEFLKKKEDFGQNSAFLKKMR